MKEGYAIEVKGEREKETGRKRKNERKERRLREDEENRQKSISIAAKSGLLRLRAIITSIKQRHVLLNATPTESRPCLSNRANSKKYHAQQQSPK